MLLDLFNREIIGYSSGPNKDAELVKKAFSTVKTEFINNQKFETQEQLEYELADYVN